MAAIEPAHNVSAETLLGEFNTPRLPSLTMIAGLHFALRLTFSLVLELKQGDPSLDNPNS
jgi:hypothetical protein